MLVVLLWDVFFGISAELELGGGGSAAFSIARKIQLECKHTLWYLTSCLSLNASAVIVVVVGVVVDDGGGGGASPPAVADFAAVIAVAVAVAVGTAFCVPVAVCVVFTGDFLSSIKTRMPSTKLLLTKVKKRQWLPPAPAPALAPLAKTMSTKEPVFFSVDKSSQLQPTSATSSHN